MKRKALLISLLLWSMIVAAQTDPIIMTIAGQPVSRSEFEYSYNKNNGKEAIDPKTVEEYAELFINYKLKVRAALDARLDTLSSFKNEFTVYRNQQVKPLLITDADVEAEARKIYEQRRAQIGDKGLIHPAHIFIRVPQNAPKEALDRAKQRIDSIYAALRGGADFATLAEKYSEDPMSARQGGTLPWFAPGETLEDFEKTAYRLKTGETAPPMLSFAGYHIIRMLDRKQMEPFDELKADIIRALKTRNIREKITDERLKEMAETSKTGKTEAQIMDEKAAELSEKEQNLKYLIAEYHDGLLLYEISNRMIWEKAAQDEAALTAYFKKHKKTYQWDSPRYKGIAYYVKEASDVKKVKQCLRGKAFEEWPEVLRKAFNTDNTPRIRVEKGLFKQGDNALIDREVFHKDTTVVQQKDCPVAGVYGKLLKAPKEMSDVRGLVTADYQDYLEAEWVQALRRKYPVVIHQDVLATVNKH